MKHLVCVAAMSVLLPFLPRASAEDCVLLRNGNVMTGLAQREGDRVSLTRHDSQFWLPASSVAVIRPTLRGLYAWQRSQVDDNSMEQRLRLATWCIEQQLYSEASRELLDVRSLSAVDPRVAAVEQRLRRAAFPVQKASYQAALPSTTPAPAADAQLDQLPAGSLETFTRQIQPLLVNNCTQSGCHQVGGDRDFQLNRDLLHGMASQRSTRVNLAAVLAAIDLDAPGASPLLKAAREPHAGSPTAAFAGRHEPLGQKLEAWVRGVAFGEPPASPASRARQTGGVFGLVKEQRERDQMLQRDAGDSQPPVGLRDEFDPEVFNRRYRTARR